MFNDVKLFLPQAKLEEWLLEEVADLQGDQLVLSKTKERFPATPAVHFRQLAGGQDAKGLVAKVKTQAQLDQLGAEKMAGSVVLGETAYEVVEGYLVEATAPSAAAPAPKPVGEADLLADFLLGKL
jgi:hypothetical protein